MQNRGLNFCCGAAELGSLAGITTETDAKKALFAAISKDYQAALYVFTDHDYSEAKSNPPPGVMRSRGQILASLIGKKRWGMVVKAGPDRYGRLSMWAWAPNRAFVTARKKG